MRWFVAGLWLCLASGAASEPSLQNVRFGGGGASTRVVFDLDSAVDYAVFVVGTGKPRVAVDLPRIDFALDGVAEWAPERNSGVGIGAGLVQRYRFGHNTPQISRVTLDLASNALVEKHFLLKPSADSPNFRLVVDLKAADEAAFEAAAGRTVAASAAPADAAAASSTNNARRVVVIDPGHGGRDPGAIGPAGGREKDVVLAVSRALRDALEKRGRYDVHMTRDDDVLIQLGDRVKFARRKDADVFISVHANALGDRSTFGSAVYTLSHVGYGRAKRQVLSADPSEAIRGVDLNEYPEEVDSILADLVLRDTNNQSALLARELLTSIETQHTLLRRPHRQENFAVLLAPDVAAVLVEAAFISNPEDEKRLRSSSWRAKMAEAIAVGVDRYFAGQPGLQAAR